MTSKMVAVVDANSSKADEVAALRKMAQCAVEGSYLASLLTPQLLDWVDGQIEMDLPPDIMEQLGCQRDREREALTELSRVRQELADADRKAGWAAKKVEDRHQTELRNARQEVSATERAMRGWQDRWAAAYDKVEAHRDSVLYLWGFLCWMMGKRDEAERLVEQTKVKAFAMLAKVLLAKPQEESE